eukprot:Hpha_TRINITY_DN8729_c0_g1::TRINITY_DN8729_c0_g1_i1::g.45368::m.45368
MVSPVRRPAVSLPPALRIRTDFDGVPDTFVNCFSPRGVGFDTPLPPAGGEFPRALSPVPTAYIPGSCGPGGLFSPSPANRNQAISPSPSFGHGSPTGTSPSPPMIGMREHGGYGSTDDDEIMLQTTPVTPPKRGFGAAAAARTPSTGKGWVRTPSTGQGGVATPTLTPQRTPKRTPQKEAPGVIGERAGGLNASYVTGFHWGDGQVREMRDGDGMQVVQHRVDGMLYFATSLDPSRKAIEARALDALRTARDGVLLGCPPRDVWEDPETKRVFVVTERPPFRRVSELVPCLDAENLTNFTDWIGSGLSALHNRDVVLGDVGLKSLVAARKPGKCFWAEGGLCYRILHVSAVEEKTGEGVKADWVQLAVSTLELAGLLPSPRARALRKQAREDVEGWCRQWRSTHFDIVTLCRSPRLPSSLQGVLPGMLSGQPFRPTSHAAPSSSSHIAYAEALSSREMNLLNQIEIAKREYAKRC